MAQKFEQKIKELGLTEAGLSDKVKTMIADFRQGLKERGEWEKEMDVKLKSDIPQSEKDSIQQELADDLDEVNKTDAEIEKAISAFYRGKQMAAGRQAKKSAPATPPAPPAPVVEPPVVPAPPVEEPVIVPPVVEETPAPVVEETPAGEDEKKEKSGVGGFLALVATVGLAAIGIQYFRNR